MLKLTLRKALAPQNLIKAVLNLHVLEWGISQQHPGMEPLVTDYGKRLEPNNPNLFNDFGKIIKARMLTPERQGGIVPIGAEIARNGRG